MLPSSSAYYQAIRASRDSAVTLQRMHADRSALNTRHGKPSQAAIHDKLVYKYQAQIDQCDLILALAEKLAAQDVVHSNATVLSSR